MGVKVIAEYCELYAAETADKIEKWAWDIFGGTGVYQPFIFNNWYKPPTIKHLYIQFFRDHDYKLLTKTWPLYRIKIHLNSTYDEELKHLVVQRCKEWFDYCPEIFKVRNELYIDFNNEEDIVAFKLLWI